MSDRFRSMEYVPPRMLTRILSGVCWEGTPESRTMALTFDDGPDPEITPAVLDTLGEAGVRGTFFLVGKRVQSHPDIVRMIAEGGHRIGNHSMSHSRMIFMKQNEVEEEIDGVQKAVEDAAGVTPVMFRPPYGVFDFTCARAVKERAMKLVLWTVLSGDYSDDSRDVILRRVTPFVRAGSIVVFHDTEKGGGWNLPGIIREIALLAGERNIRLGGVDELSLSNEISMSEEA
jgi:peptidoglycan/xylan/chitin deacetylase (PgdA/CDA1 family)